MNALRSAFDFLVDTLNLAVSIVFAVWIKLAADEMRMVLPRICDALTNNVIEKSIYFSNNGALYSVATIMANISLSDRLLLIKFPIILMLFIMAMMIFHASYLFYRISSAVIAVVFLFFTASPILNSHLVRKFADQPTGTSLQEGLSRVDGSLGRIHLDGLLTYLPFIIAIKGNSINSGKTYIPKLESMGMITL